MELRKDIAKLFAKHIGSPNPSNAIAYIRNNDETLFSLQGETSNSGFQVVSDIEEGIFPSLNVEIRHYIKGMQGEYVINFPGVFKYTEVIPIVAELISKIDEGVRYEEWVAKYENSKFVLEKK